MAGTDSGNPAARTALRPTLIACSPTCMTHPMITSSTIAGSRSLRSTRAFKRLGCKIDRVPATELAVALPPGGANCVDDDCCGHRWLLSKVPNLTSSVKKYPHSVIVPGSGDAATPLGYVGHRRLEPDPRMEYHEQERKSRKDMDRWLGDGGMEIIGLVGADFCGYGVDGEDLGWVTATWTPTELACNPHGTAQAGVHSLLLDAAMNFAINAALRGRDRTRGTLGDEDRDDASRRARCRFRVRGEVVRMARQVAFAEATVHDSPESPGEPGNRHVLAPSPRGRLWNEDAAVGGS